MRAGAVYPVEAKGRFLPFQLDPEVILGIDEQRAQSARKRRRVSA